MLSECPRRHIGARGKSQVHLERAGSKSRLAPAPCARLLVLDHLQGMHLNVGSLQDHAADHQEFTSTAAAGRAALRSPSQISPERRIEGPEMSLICFGSLCSAVQVLCAERPHETEEFSRERRRRQRLTSGRQRRWCGVRRLQLNDGHFNPASMKRRRLPKPITCVAQCAPTVVA